MEGISDLFLESRRAILLDPNAVLRALRYHALIADALRLRNAPQARLLMQGHMNSMLDEVSGLPSAERSQAKHMRIAVTGGNGDMGRSLIPYLLEQGHTVVSIDRTIPATHMAGAEFLIADTRDFGQLVASIRGCDALIHLAAIRAAEPS